MIDPLTFIAGWMAGLATGVGLMRPPRDRNLDWRRSFNHENINRPSGPPPPLYQPRSQGGPTPLSPAAQAVWDAAWQLSPVNCKSHEDRRRQQIAAALRAAADQVVPHSEVMPQQDLESRREAMVWGMVNQTQVTRQQLLAIAAELEGTNE